MQAPNYKAVCEVVPDEEIEDAAEQAHVAFFDAVKATFPNIATWVLPSDINIEVTKEFKKTVVWWLFFNDPRIH